MKLKLHKCLLVKDRKPFKFRANGVIGMSLVWYPSMYTCDAYYVIIIIYSSFVSPQAVGIPNDRIEWKYSSCSI